LLPKFAIFSDQGEPVAVMHGANAPLLQRMIEKEIRKERQVLKGEASRDIITMEEAVPCNSRSWFNIFKHALWLF
jgi:hypothetical protein